MKTTFRAAIAHSPITTSIMLDTDTNALYSQHNIFFFELHVLDNTYIPRQASMISNSLKTFSDVKRIAILLCRRQNS